MDDRNGVLRGIATRPAKRAAMVIHSTIAVEAGLGLAGDFIRKPKRQVTVLAWEKWLAACAELGVAPDQIPATVPWTFRRANLLLAGIDLAPTVGRRLAIGPVVLEITGETDPCQRMEEQRAGLQAALTPDTRGGALTTIITGGKVTVGDPVRWL
jgi:MOSC domain-containing protein YiiM